ncbi:hypothetical protein [Bradyrhizobium sp.]|jgi:hypothetical protein|uniref:hypothetical protein n=1 Tax=Bradyrhizobium sp. TaxID=376 RepID=UPI002DDD93BB|nr:hypothetical protein [Bradyrhizobium sp.]HEV2160438.1 hypothetical protein [Bradyrhizobium sp.]
MDHRTNHATWKITHISDELGFVEEVVPVAKLDARLSELRSTLTTRRVMAEPISADMQ